MPVWVAPKGSKAAKLAAFVVYLREMQARAAYHGGSTQDDETSIAALARADVYSLVARQLEALL